METIVLTVHKVVSDAKIWHSALAVCKDIISLIMNVLFNVCKINIMILIFQLVKIALLKIALDVMQLMLQIIKYAKIAIHNFICKMESARLNAI